MMNRFVLKAVRTLRSAFLCTVLLVAAAGAQTPAKRPNVLIVLADDLGYSDLGCFGGEVRTPHLDALARGGLRLTNFYNNARCCPTRGSLLTGLYPHQAGVGEMTRKTDLPSYAGRLKPDQPTVAEVLKSGGYATALFGKWHVSNTFEGSEHLKDLNRQRVPNLFGPIEQYPTRRGFDTYWGGIWGVENFYNPFSLVDGETAVKTLPEKFYLTDAINDHAADYIKAHAGDARPFFVYLAHNAPHWPLHALPEDIEKYRGQYADGYDAVRQARYRRQAEMGLIDPTTAPLPPTLGTANWAKMTPEQRRFHAALFQTHAAMIDRMDQGLGRVFGAIKEAGKWDDTLIVFLSDNGASPERYENPGFDRATLTRDGRPIEYRYDDLTKLAGPEDTWYYIGRDWANVANTPYRRAKASQYNGGERAPTIVHWPNGITAKPGSFVRARGHVMDLMATALDAAGVAMPAEFHGRPTHPLQGRSLLPLFKGETDRPDYPTLFGEHEGGRSVLTSDGWKLIRDRGEREWKLFHVAADETENDDLAAREPERVKAMQAAWEQWAKDNAVLPKP